MDYGGLADCNLYPAKPDVVEVRIGTRHLFDLIRGGDGWFVRYKTTKQDPVITGLPQLLQILTPLMMGDSPKKTPRIN